MLPACTFNQQSQQHPSTQANIKAAVGGTLTFGQASLIVAPNALASDATVTLTNYGKDFLPTKDPGLQFASNAFQIDTKDANGKPVEILNSTAILKVKPDTLDLTKSQDLVIATINPDHPNSVNLLHSKGTVDGQGKTLSVLTVSAIVPGTRAWVASIPRIPDGVSLNQTLPTSNAGVAPVLSRTAENGSHTAQPLAAAIPLTTTSAQTTTTPYLTVPYYFQGPYPWCAPTSTAAFLSYYDMQGLHVHGNDPLDTFFGESTVPNWQLAAMNHQAGDSGGFQDALLDHAGVPHSQYVYHDWDPTFLASTPSATSDFDSYVYYLAGTNAANADQQRPVMLSVGLPLTGGWHHALVIVGSDTNGLYLHDSNGEVGVYVTWGRFNQVVNQDYQVVIGQGYSGRPSDNEDPLPEQPSSNHWPRLPYISTVAIVGNPPVRPESARSGSISVLPAYGSTPYIYIDGIPGYRATYLRWDGSDTHPYGYYWDYETGSATHPDGQLGGSQAHGATLHFRVPFINAADHPQEYTALLEMRGADGDHHVTKSVTLNAAFGPRSVVDGVGAIKLPLDGNQAIFDIKLFLGSDTAAQPIDVRFLRINMTGPHAGPSVHITRPSNGTHGRFPLSFTLSVNAADGYGQTLPASQVHWIVTGPNTFSTTFAGFNPSFVPPTPGTYTVRVTGTDAEGGSASDTITLTSDAPIAITQPPNLTVSAPTNGATYHVGDSVGFVASAVQPETSMLLPGSAINWYFNGSSSPVFNGGSFSHTFTTTGDVSVRVTATNSAGLVATRTLTLHIQLASGGTGTVHINSPANNTPYYTSGGSSTVSVSFAATVTGGLTVRWYDDTTGGTQLGTGPSITANLGDTNPACGTPHHIRAVGYNSLNQAVSTATVTVVIYACIP